MTYVLSPTKSRALIERAAPGWASSSVVYRVWRYLPRGTYMKLILPPGGIGVLTAINSDLIRYGTSVTVNDPNFANENYVRDWDTNTWGNAPSTSVNPTTEVTELTYGLGEAKTGFVFLRCQTNSSGHIYTRIYVSADGSTYTQVLNVNPTSPTSYAAYVTNIRYIQVRAYNSYSYALNLNDTNWKLISLEFYLPGNTTIVGDGTSTIYTALAYNTVYQLIEVWEI